MVGAFDSMAIGRYREGMSTTASQAGAPRIIYRIDPRTFQDTDGDGYGNLDGIASRIDYIASLGADAIWLAPLMWEDTTGAEQIDARLSAEPAADLEDLAAQAHDAGLQLFVDPSIYYADDPEDNDGTSAEISGTLSIEPGWHGIDGAIDPSMMAADAEDTGMALGEFNLFADMGDDAYAIDGFDPVSADPTDPKTIRRAKARMLVRQLALTDHIHSNAAIIGQGEELGTLASQSTPPAPAPMQWDATTYAGFTAPYAPTAPWLPIGSDKDTANVKAQRRDPESMLAFTKNLIALLRDEPALAGELEVLAAGPDDDPDAIIDGNAPDPDASPVVVFARTAEAAPTESGATVRRRVLVVANLSAHGARIPAAAASELGLDLGPYGMGVGGASVDRMLVSTCAPESTAASMLMGKLSPWEAFAYVL